MAGRINSRNVLVAGSPGQLVGNDFLGDLNASGLDSFHRISALGVVHGHLDGVVIGLLDLFDLRLHRFGDGHLAGQRGFAVLRCGGDIRLTGSHGSYGAAGIDSGHSLIAGSPNHSGLFQRFGDILSLGLTVVGDFQLAGLAGLQGQFSRHRQPGDVQAATGDQSQRQTGDDCNRKNLFHSVFLLKISLTGFY